MRSGSAVPASKEVPGMRRTSRCQLIRLRACPRCGGDLILDLDDYLVQEGEEDEYACLQCGRRIVETPAGIQGQRPVPERIAV